MNILSVLYAICAVLLALYTLGHGVLLVQFFRYRQHRPVSPAPAAYPAVTVQLPVYNEQHVAVRLINAVAQLDYPPDQLHIQILDDSDDATTTLIARHILNFPHLNIEHLRRRDRTGYKAGALAYGLEHATTDYIAIFDADFIPPRDFLKRAMPCLLADDGLAVVQTRWGHLNPCANGLTRAQVISIDNHFIVEQTARARSGWFVPFNGTGGIWRKAAIEDAGGWSDDTLTEDLDLSFRAQLRGWRSGYVPQIVVPGELPPQLAAYRQQQVRWATGGTQTFRKLVRPLWRSDLPFMTRLMATHHLVQYVPHLLMLIMLLLSPLLILNRSLSDLPLAPLGVIGLIPPLMYGVSQQVRGGDWGRRLLGFPLLLLIGTGLIGYNAVAVLDGFFRKRGEFRRTPKFVSGWQGSQYALRNQLALAGALVLMAYSGWGMLVAWQAGSAFVPYFALHLIAFATVAIWDLVDQWSIQRVGAPRLLPESGND